eukprot:CAMPEP_0179337392 /NCGR_PEP_ID=MMETSP0797-20121207/67593_1 /TAXON_ID=47934 /ORGANISM="Dinophysis acuminata, Strain DAEP01" /LENGTH=180 /DNA_ID=CAMNT_0021051025 /DNA_START=59 /DNA_END=598 /DNA_ORIENTATION=-
MSEDLRDALARLHEGVELLSGDDAIVVLVHSVKQINGGYPVATWAAVGKAVDRGVAEAPGDLRPLASFRYFGGRVNFSAGSVDFVTNLNGFEHFLTSSTGMCRLRGAPGDLGGRVGVGPEVDGRRALAHGDLVGAHGERRGGLLRVAGRRGVRRSHRASLLEGPLRLVERPVCALQDRRP